MRVRPICPARTGSRCSRPRASARSTASSAWHHGAVLAVVRLQRGTVAPELLHPRTPLVPRGTPGRPVACDAHGRKD